MYETVYDPLRLRKVFLFLPALLLAVMALWLAQPTPPAAAGLTGNQPALAEWPPHPTSENSGGAIAASLTVTGDADLFALAWASWEGNNAYGVAWGDYDSDGDLDLAIANRDLPNRIYRNDGTNQEGLQLTLAWSAPVTEDTYSVAWGDYDNDRDLDLAFGNYNTPSRVYRNDTLLGNPRPTLTSTWESPSSQKTTSIAWGDYNGDGFLDLAVGNSEQPNRVYRNVGGLNLMLDWTAAITEHTYSVAWGDMDDDGALDLAVGNTGDPTHVYRNMTGTLSLTPVYSTAESAYTYGVAWGDYDGDGFLDLALGNHNASSRVYHNEGGLLSATPAYSTSLAEYTYGIAWGDCDRDGDLDLLVANSSSQPKRIYRNDAGVLSPDAAWSSEEGGNSRGVAWGDADNDGALDFAVGNMSSPVGTGTPAWVYHNNSGLFPSEVAWTTPISGVGGLAWGDVDSDGDLDLAVGVVYPRLAPIGPEVQLYLNDHDVLHLAWTSVETGTATSVAWGDVDGDRDLDLAIGGGCSIGLPSVCSPNRIYRNIEGTLSLAWTTSNQKTTSVAWGDYDSDGDLDLVMGNMDQPTSMYRNDGVILGSLVMKRAGASTEIANTTSVAWGDVDGDGDLDLAVGNMDEPNRIYRNDGGILARSATWVSLETDSTRSVAWGDVDGDGDLDLTVGNNTQPNRLYRNEGGALLPGAAWSSALLDYTRSVAWGDADGDGDLDLAVGNYSSQGMPNRLYQNNAGTLDTHPTWNLPYSETTESLAWGDADNDGDLDLAVGNLHDTLRVYYNQRDSYGYPGAVPRVYVSRPGDDADFFSVPTIRSGIISIIYTLAHQQHHPVKYIRAWYSPDGGGRWLPAVAKSGTLTTNLATPGSYTYYWDVLASGFFGQSDNVVFRIQAVPAITHTANSTPGPFLYGSYASQTFPFRVRGTQVRVISGTVPITNALVYRLPVGQVTGGALMADTTGHPFTTDPQGYLQGRGELKSGDRLLALLPITATDTYTLYYTSGAPTLLGLDTYTVTKTGVQTLTVSAEHPLILFNLDVSLEWDAHKDDAYLDELQTNLARTSEYLYDFTNGQMALGQVNVFQNADEWGFSHVVVNANNHLRPFAAQGGVVITDTIDPQHADIRYSPGQVSMGSTWNRYGDPGQSLGDDWALILAHELSHYLLFHDDTYLGLDDAGFLIPVTTCLGSAMGDLYNDPDATEFIADEPYWQSACADTLAERTLERNEWETMQLWYPALINPTVIRPGPVLMPFDFTAITLHDPYTPTATLLDPTFYIDYAGGGAASSEARAYLFSTANGGDYVVNMGSPYGGQNRVLARGARLDDRLCVFDRPRAQFGCEDIALGDDRLSLRQDTAWNPVVQLTPINTVTLLISFTNATPITSPILARLFPDMGYAEIPITLTLTGDTYSGTFTLEYPVLAGHVQVWVDEPATETQPRRETVVAFNVGGNPGFSRGGGGFSRGGGGFSRGGGGFSRGGGGFSRGGGAPLISPDGQLIFFTENPEAFITGTLFTIQAMAGVPTLPPGRTLVGQGYSLVASPGAILPPGSVSLQYLSNDVLVAGAQESQLALYFWDGSAWIALDATLDDYFNLATAPSQGPGMYALLASIQIPLTGPGWNLFAYPVAETRPVTAALVAISGFYTTVYGYAPSDPADPWKVFDITVPPYVIDLHTLEFGKGYWINVSQNITLHLASGAQAANRNAPAQMPDPPATFYGAVLSRPGFTPAAGAPVTAWIDGHFCGQGRTLEVNGDIVYTLNVFADGLGYTSCGAPGRTVQFHVGGRAMQPVVAWDNAQLWEIPLRVAQSVYLPLVMRN